MNIWLVNPYGPLPSEAWRAYCYPLIAEALVESGHQVVWWTSNFSHHFKKYRSRGWADLHVRDGFSIRLVPTTSYKKNIGMGRVLRDAVFAYRCYSRGRKEQRPDVIIHSESPLTFGFAGHRLASLHGCHSIYHQMDLWPELIENAVRPRYRAMLKTLFGPVYRSRRRMYGELSAATALAGKYLEAVLEEAPSLRRKPNAVVYNGIDVQGFREGLLANRAPRNLPEKNDRQFWAVFAGTLGPSYDIGTLCEAARRLSRSGSKIFIVIAGDGPQRRMVEGLASKTDGAANLFYVGQLTPGELAGLYSRCDVGLCAYSSSSNVEMPDKIYDYTAAGLPVLVSLTGEVAEVVSTRGIGRPYMAGSADDLVRNLEALEADKTALAAMATASRDLGMEFDKNVQYRKFVDVVEALA